MFASAVLRHQNQLIIRALEEEISRLKRLIVDQSLDIQRLKEITSKVLSSVSVNFRTMTFLQWHPSFVAPALWVLISVENTVYSFAGPYGDQIDQIRS